jgi:ribonuclease HI
MPTDPANIEVIYTDGSCLKQHDRKKRRAGYAVNFGEGDPRNISEPVEGEKHSNQVAELMAVAVALERSTPGKRIVIYSDSQYVIRGLYGMDGEMPWYIKWKKNGWRNAKGHAVENRDLWQRTITAASNRSFRLLYVAGHSGNAGNDAADAMANAGAMRSISNSEKRIKLAVRLAAQKTEKPSEIEKLQKSMADMDKSFPRSAAQRLMHGALIAAMTRCTTDHETGESTMKRADELTEEELIFRQEAMAPHVDTSVVTQPAQEERNARWARLHGH